MRNLLFLTRTNSLNTVISGYPGKFQNTFKTKRTEACLCSSSWPALTAWTALFIKFYIIFLKRSYFTVHATFIFVVWINVCIFRCWPVRNKDNVCRVCCQIVLDCCKFHRLELSRNSCQAISTTKLDTGLKVIKRNCEWHLHTYRAGFLTPSAFLWTWAPQEIWSIFSNFFDAPRKNFHGSGSSWGGAEFEVCIINWWRQMTSQ